MELSHNSNWFVPTLQYHNLFIPVLCVISSVFENLASLWSIFNLAAIQMPIAADLSRLQHHNFSIMAGLQKWPSFFQTIQRPSPAEALLYHLTARSTLDQFYNWAGISI